MNTEYKKILRCLAFGALTVATGSFEARSQSLPSNPWAAQQQPVQQQQYPQQYQQPVYQQQQPTVVYQQVVMPGQGTPVYYGSQPYQPTYEGGADNIWNTKMPEFTGELTTWGKDYGQRATAPEVNMHNILSITRHLRAMGYDIPTGFEEKFKKAPAAVKKRIMASLATIERGSNKNPVYKGANFLMDQFEKETGLTFDNLLGNSLDLLSAK